jgi:hypothetical protein
VQNIVLWCGGVQLCLAAGIASVSSFNRLSLLGGESQFLFFERQERLERLKSGRTWKCSFIGAGPQSISHGGSITTLHNDLLVRSSSSADARKAWVEDQSCNLPMPESRNHSKALGGFHTASGSDLGRRVPSLHHGVCMATPWVEHRSRSRRRAVCSTQRSAEGVID